MMNGKYASKDSLYACQKRSHEKFVMLYLCETRSEILSANNTKITILQRNLNPGFLVNFLRELKRILPTSLKFKFFEDYFI